ncbi:MAG: hypothetical protein SFT92_00600 [Rickettsiales bacterium]|nr:hypothetical protein [Rickettsiales bacterium]
MSSPYVDANLFEIESRNRFDSDRRASENGYRQHILKLSYGINDWFGLELSGKLEHLPQQGHSFSGNEIEAVFQFTETGEYWLDTGMKVGYGAAYTPYPYDANSVSVNWLLAKRTEHFLHLANIIIDHEVGTHANANPEAEFRWASRVRHNQWINPGIEYYAAFGEISDSGSFDEQKHLAGPALYGDLPYDGLSYETGWLFGLSDAAEDQMVKLYIKYEFSL